MRSVITGSYYPVTVTIHDDSDMDVVAEALAKICDVVDGDNKNHLYCWVDSVWEEDDFCRYSNPAKTERDFNRVLENVADDWSVDFDFEVYNTEYI